MLLCSVEFVLLESLKAQGTCTIFRTSKSLGFGILGMWICEILLRALESVLFKET